MRLIEAILEANHAALTGKPAELHLDQFKDELPLAALTCIDPRLNRLLPGVLGIDEERFIWLRNAGNVITSSTSSTVRSLAVSVYLKGAREIVILGHTDCRMSKLTMMDLLNRMQAQGVQRTALEIPNLQEFFGLFSSETQNVIKGVGYVRQSPVIPAKMPVHGLILNTATGRLDWVVNGYQPLAQAIGAGPSLKELVTSELPAGTPRILTDTLGQLADKVQPLAATKWESLTAKLEARVVEAIPEPVKKVAATLRGTAATPAKGAAPGARPGWAPALNRKLGRDAVHGVRKPAPPPDSTGKTPPPLRRG